MNIENSIPQGWKLGYIVAAYTKNGEVYECQIETIGEGENPVYGREYTIGSTPTEAFTKACDKARKYNIKKLMEECMAREDGVGKEATKPCRSPYCECDAGKCTHPGFYDARGE